MDDLTRTEYPSMLANLQPAQAVQALSERVKRINRINLEVADWFQERRRIEEQYALGLRRLAQYKVPNSQTELGIFQTPWNTVLEAVETIAQSHHHFAERLEQEVENPLRVFQHRKDASTLNTMTSNLAATAKEFEEAQDKSEKLGKKGGKASTQKVDAATSKLESVSQQWESQAPYIFETLQALDESRVNQMRDLLTQYQTFETEQAQRTQDKAVETLAQMLEISTEIEIQAFVSKITSGRPRVAASRTGSRQNTGLSSQGSAAALPQPPLPSGNTLTPSTSNQQLPQPSPQQPSQSPSQPPATRDDSDIAPPASSEPEPKSKLRRLGTMFGGRRRQSIHGGLGLSPQRPRGFGGPPGRGISPRASAGNLRDRSRLSSLEERPDLPNSDQAREPTPRAQEPSHEGANGVVPGESLLDAPIPMSASSGGINGTQDTDVSDVPPPPGPPPSHQAQTGVQPGKDSEGFSTPAPLNDPISEAQREAAGEDAEQMFKLNIQKTPIEEEDPEAKKAAMSSVSNTLRMGPATRRSGTIRGRRDVRNTIYVPSGSNAAEVLPQSQPQAQPENSMSSIPGSPPLGTSSSRPSAVAALASENSIAGSDSQSVRSGTSLSSLAHVKHADMTQPGLNTSIIETVSAVFEDGVVKSTTISGEIAFVYNTSDTTSSKTHQTIKIDNFTSLERIGPNRIFVQNVSPDLPEQFNLDLSHLSKTSTAFSYKVFAEEADPPSLAKHTPLLLKPAWKPQGDKLGLLLQYQLNPSSTFTAPVTLHNVVLMGSYGGKASGAQTKPTGTHLKDRHLVYWRLGDVTLTNETQKIVCRVVGHEGAEPTPGHVEARWEYIASGNEVVGSGISISRLEEGKGKTKEVADDDPFADENTAGDQTWVEVPLSRKLVSGKYEGKHS